MQIGRQYVEHAEQTVPSNAIETIRCMRAAVSGPYGEKPCGYWENSQPKEQDVLVSMP